MIHVHGDHGHLCENKKKVFFLKSQPTPEVTRYRNKQNSFELIFFFFLIWWFQSDLAGRSERVLCLMIKIYKQPYWPFLLAKMVI